MIADKKLLKIVTQFTDGITGGDINRKCYMVTAPLQSYLSLCGVETKLINGEVETPTQLWEHFWLELLDGRIIDPTAGQFKELSLPKIYLGELPSGYRLLS